MHHRQCKTSVTIIFWIGPIFQVLQDYCWSFVFQVRGVIVFFLHCFLSFMRHFAQNVMGYFFLKQIVTSNNADITVEKIDEQGTLTVIKEGFKKLVARRTEQS